MLTNKFLKGRIFRIYKTAKIPLDYSFEIISFSFRCQQSVIFFQALEYVLDSDILSSVRLFKTTESSTLHQFGTNSEFIFLKWNNI